MESARPELAPAETLANGLVSYAGGGGVALITLVNPPANGYSHAMMRDRPPYCCCCCSARCRVCGCRCCWACCCCCCCCCKGCVMCPAGCWVPDTADVGRCTPAPAADTCTSEQQAEQHRRPAHKGNQSKRMDGISNKTISMITMQVLPTYVLCWVHLVYPQMRHASKPTNWAQVTVASTVYLYSVFVM